MIKNIVIAALISFLATFGFTKAAEAHNTNGVWVDHGGRIVTKKIKNSGTECIILGVSPRSNRYEPITMSCNWNK